MTSRTLSPIRSLPRLLTALLLVGALLASGCGGDGFDGSSAVADADAEVNASAEAGAEAAASDTSILENTLGGEVDGSMLENTEGGESEAAQFGTPVDLFEWGLAAPAAIGSGEVLFSITNSGQFDHELAIARGTSYEELPLLESGAVDEAALGDNFVGRSETIGSQTIEQTFLLEPGNYVFFCNIVVGGTSHAANGQVQSVTVG